MVLLKFLNFEALYDHYNLIDSIKRNNKLA